MRDYSENIDRKKLVTDLESLIKNKDNSLNDKELIIEVAKHSLQLLEEYDNVVRCIAMQLSAGGFNSEGLMSPDVAYKKIQCGINYYGEGFKSMLLEKQKEIDKLKMETH